MRKFITNSLYFAFLFTALLFSFLTISSLWVKQGNFENHSTESNTLWLPENEKYDLLFMGISHARNFTRHRNQFRLEEILDLKIANIGQGSGICGINEQLFYLDYFYHKKNKVSKIIYVLSPPLLFTETLALASNTFDNEAFEPSFLARYLTFKSENKNARIMSYLQSKFHPRWWQNKPYSLKSMDDKLDTLDMAQVKKGQDFVYNSPELEQGRFDKSTQKIEASILLAKQNNSQVIFLIPPALFGKWRKHEQTISFAQSMKKKYSNVQLFDASETVLNPKFYYDNHHLNSEGVVFFTNKYLKSIVFKNDKSSK